MIRNLIGAFIGSPKYTEWATAIDPYYYRSRYGAGVRNAGAIWKGRGSGTGVYPQSGERRVRSPEGAAAP